MEVEGWGGRFAASVKEKSHRQKEDRSIKGICSQCLHLRESARPVLQVIPETWPRFLSRRSRVISKWKKSRDRSLPVRAFTEPKNEKRWKKKEEKSGRETRNGARGEKEIDSAIKPYIAMIPSFFNQHPF